MDNKMSNDNLEIFSKAEIEFIEKYMNVYDVGLKKNGFNSLKQYELEMKLDIHKNKLDIEFLEDRQVRLNYILFNQKKENKHKWNFVEIYDIWSENIKYAKKLIEKMSSLAEDIIYKEEIEKSISIFNGIDFELNDWFTEKDFENKTVKVINNDFETFMEEIYILDLETLEVLKKEEQESKGQ